MILDYKILEQIMANNGIKVFGITSKDNMPESKIFKKWQEEGNDGGLEYLKRSPDFYFTLENIIPDAKNIITCAFFYESANYKLAPLKEGYGRIARFAFGKNYHKPIKKILEKVKKDILDNVKNEGKDDEARIRVFADAVPLCERSIARSVQIGFVGKSSMLINEKYGSFFFIGDIVTNINITNIPKYDISNIENLEKKCATCNACQKACKNKVKESGLFNVNRCTSYLTIEKKGYIERENWPLLENWIFGCDMCQIACKHNALCKSIENKLNLGHNVTNDGLMSFDDLLSIKTDEDFLKRFQGTSLMRAGRENIVRNVLIVIANKGEKLFIEKVKEILSNDVSSVVRQTASEVLKVLEI